MNRAKELLEQATPLPWRDDQPALNNRLLDGRGRYAFTLPDGVTGGDARLIVYAVNRLPDYEAAVEALDRIVHHFNRDAIDDGILALARLRDEEESA